MKNPSTVGLVIRGQEQGHPEPPWAPGEARLLKPAAGTARQGHGVKKKNQTKKPRHKQPLGKRARNFFAHKNQTVSYRKAFPIPPPATLACPSSAGCLDAEVSWCLWFFNHRVLALSGFVWGFVQKRYLWPAAEVGFPLSSVSGYWTASSLSPSVNYFLPACHLAVTSAGSIDLVTVPFQTCLKFQLTSIILR